MVCLIGVPRLGGWPGWELFSRYCYWQILNTQFVMAINLQKGQRVNVGLSKVAVGLGWEPAVSGKEADLDASVFMIGKNGKLPEDEFFVFYNNLQSPDPRCFQGRTKFRAGQGCLHPCDRPRHRLRNDEI